MNVMNPPSNTQITLSNHRNLLNEGSLKTPGEIFGFATDLNYKKREISNSHRI